MRGLWMLLAIGCGPPAHGAVERQPPAPVVPPVAAHRIAAGRSFSCVARATGHVACWGTNQHGELGRGDFVEQPAPAEVPALTDIVEVASSAPSSRVCARTRDAAVWCWGGGEATPGRVDRLAGADEIAVGTRYACARSGATIRCVGDRKAPALDIAIPFASRIAVGTTTICARTSGGHVACRPLPGAPDDSHWEDTAVIDIGVPGLRTALAATTVIDLGELAGVAELAAAGDVLCARTDAGAVWCWSADAKPVGRLDNAPPVQQLVVGGNTWGCMQATDRAGCWGYPPPGTSDTIVAGVAANPTTAQLAAGVAHACVFAPPETVTCGGSNAFGEAGVDPDRHTVRPVEVPDLADATALTAGDGLTCALRAGGRITCWGTARYGLVSEPRIDLPLSGARAIALATDHGCALLAGGTIACWGESGEGQTGFRDRSALHADDPVRDFVPRVRGVTGATALALTDDAACAVTAAGIVCWGDSGLVDNRTRVSPCDEPIAAALCRAQEQPRLVPGTQDAVAIAGTTRTVCFTRKDGQVGCFAGKLPIRTVANITGAVALTAGFEQVCALTRDGRAVCFDASDPTAALSATPRDDLSVPVTSIALGTSHGCALTGGTVACWGENDTGQLGDGTLVPHATAASVALTGVTAVAVGGSHSCALRASGHVACWGRPRALGQSSYPATIAPVTLALPVR